MKKNPSKTVIVVAGPTAVGKTSVAIQLAKHFQTEIISADSRQCFKELNIGVARPSPIELQQIPHHFIASHSIHEEITAASFEQYALQLTNDLFKKKDVIVMVGGTGLYIKAFCEGLDKIPDIDPAIRTRIIKQYDEFGLDWLQQELKEKDPDYHAKGEIQNPQRLMRALEVKEATGQSIFSFHNPEKAKRNFNIVKIGLELPRQQLINQINQRVDEMMKAGLVDEVKSLAPNRHLNALQTVGYLEIFDHLDGKFSLNEAIERIRINTRQYAKRQMTWFRKDKNFNWFTPFQVTDIQTFVNDFTQSR